MNIYLIWLQKAYRVLPWALSDRFGHILLFDIFTPSSIFWPSFDNFFSESQYQKVKIKEGQKRDEWVEILKSNIWLNVQEMAELHLKSVFKKLVIMHRFHFINNKNETLSLKAGCRMILMVTLNMFFCKLINYKFIRKHYGNPNTFNIQDFMDNLHILQRYRTFWNRPPFVTPFYTYV